MKISARANSIPASMTLDITAKVKQLKKEGKSIIGFTPTILSTAQKPLLTKGLPNIRPSPGLWS